jgi:hypothetical protein
VTITVLSFLLVALLALRRAIKRAPKGCEVRRAPKGCEECLGAHSCLHCSIQGTQLCAIVNGGAS